MPTYEYECMECGRQIEIPLVRPEDRDPDMHCTDGPKGLDCNGYMKRLPSWTQSYIGSKDRPTRGQG